jgi:hypothetical protein
MRADTFNSGLSGEWEGRGAPGRWWAGVAREGDWGRPKMGDDPDGWSRLSVSVRGRGEAGRLSWATGERVGRGRQSGRLRRSGPEGLRAAVC